MPLLDREPERFPRDLFDGGAVPNDDGRLWWVLHTRPRQEKAVARYVYTHQIPFYLPLIDRRVQVRDRILTAHTPLFSGYVFLLATAEERLQALPPKRLVGTLPVSDQGGLWQELRQVYRLVESGAPITPEDRLAPGDLVEIRNGKLAGLRGTIVRDASGDRFVIRVNFIQHGASVLVEGFNVAPVR